MTFSYKFGSAPSALYVALRASSANLSPITDCDEVFNYWEPLHYVLYGTGMQTWEYAPQYALRTYAYLLPMAAVAKSFLCLLDWLPPSFVEQLFTLLLMSSSTESTSTTVALGASSPHDNKPLLFAMLRSFLALVSCYSELSFLAAVHDVIGPTIAHWTAICSLTSAGNFHAGQAFLPSSTVMILWRLSTANQLRGGHALAIFWGLVAVLAAGWPFCAVLFVSTGVWALWKASGLAGGGDLAQEGKSDGRLQIGSIMRVLMRTALHAILIQALVMTVDHHFYGRVVSPIWNIFVYNARSGGDELYGVEPLSYYAKNLLLNFNLVSMLGLVSLPVLLLRKMTGRFYPEMCLGHECKPNSESLEILVLAPMYIWMAIVLPRPHKEERFLFPIYPMLCFGTALTLREALGLFDKVMYLLRGSKEPADSRRKNVNLLLGLALLFPSALISISRSFALHHYYSAPLALHRRLFSHAVSSAVSPTSSGNGIAHVCTAGEWYRFPSSFFLPPNHQLGFLKSSFTGQLPQPFTAHGSKVESLSSAGAGGFNDMNREEMDRYIDIEQCSYVVELVPLDSESSSDVPECLQYMESDSSAGSWKQVASYDYLDADSTPALHRILYLPFGRKEKVAFKGYNLYARDFLA